MQVNVSRTCQTEAVLEIEVPSEDVDKAIQRAYLKVVKRANIPGFRKGKAPKAIVERFLGKGVLLQEALDDLLPETYGKAIETSSLQPVDSPKMEILQLEEGKSLKYKATVEVKPDVKLGDYRGIRNKVEMKLQEVTEEDVERELERLREQNARLVVDEDKSVKKDSYVLVELSGEIGGEPLPNQTVEGITLHVGSEMIAPGFDDQITGMKVGEEKDIRLEYPEDYFDEGLRGKEASFHVIVREVKKRELPELNDDFAQEVKGLKSLQELKDDLANTLRGIAEARARAEFEEEVVRKVVDEAEVELPPSLVERRTQTLTGELMRELAMRNITWQEYLNQTGKTEDQIKEQLRAQAEEGVKRSLVIEAVIKNEGISASTEEVEKEAEKWAAIYRASKEGGNPFLEGQGREMVEDGILRRKAVRFLAYGSPKEVAGSEASQGAAVSPEPPEAAASETGADGRLSGTQSEDPDEGDGK